MANKKNLVKIYMIERWVSPRRANACRISCHIMNMTDTNFVSLACYSIDYSIDFYTNTYLPRKLSIDKEYSLIADSFNVIMFGRDKERLLNTWNEFFCVHEKEDFPLENLENWVDQEIEGFNEQGYPRALELLAQHSQEAKEIVGDFRIPENAIRSEMRNA